jgi:hypothetical protein
MDSVIDQFFAAWSAPDSDEQVALIEGAMAPKVSHSAQPMRGRLGPMRWLAIPGMDLG